MRSLYPSAVAITLALTSSSRTLSQPQPQPPVAAAKASARPVEILAVQGEVRSGKNMASRVFVPGETLHSGDLVSVRVAVDQPAYVYLVGREANGTPFVIFPSSGDLKVEAGTVKTLPADGSAVELDARAGEETLYVVASNQRLSNSSPDVLRQLLTGGADRGLRPMSEEPSTLPPPPPQPEPSRPPPMPVPTDERGLRLICAQTAGAVCARSVRGGIAVAKLTFSHTNLTKKGPLPTNAR